jgi:hypothetical protein
MAQAQTFTYAYNDLILGFRQTSPAGNNEVVVDIGQASGYTSLTVGTKITVPGFTPSQVSPGSFTSFNRLSWSVFGPYASGYSGYPNHTLWLTVPRTNNAVISASPTRLNFSPQGLLIQKMSSIVGYPGDSGGAEYISSNVASNQFNTSSFVQEVLASYSGNNLSTWLAGGVDPTQATFDDTWPSTEPNGGDVEVTTPVSFTSGTVRSDLYEVRPMTTATGALVTDPHTGTSGPAWYVGYFELSPNGTLTFTRDAASTAPAQVTLSIAQTSNTNTISFASSSGVTYTLLYTNEAGLGSPISNWPSRPGAITGDGTTKSFEDTTTDAVRFYRVLEH